MRAKTLAIQSVIENVFPLSPLICNILNTLKIDPNVISNPCITHLMKLPFFSSPNFISVWRMILFPLCSPSLLLLYTLSLIHLNLWKELVMPQSLLSGKENVSVFQECLPVLCRIYEAEAFETLAIVLCLHISGIFGIKTGQLLLHLAKA